MYEILFGILIGIAYMTCGIGTARACAKVAGRDLRILDVFFWPIAICVIAAAGGIT